jgi:RES domain-containing protein
VKPNLTLANHAGRYWRAGFLDRAAQLLNPAGAPHGRWHHHGQKALYLSGSPEGCQVALRVYVEKTDPPRGIFPFQISGARIVDLRDATTRAALGVPLPDIHAFWADIAAQGKVSPTWDLSDHLRDLGLDGLLSPSRSRPDLTHLTLFNWNAGNGPQVIPDGKPEPFDPDFALV